VISVRVHDEKAHTL